MGGATAGRPTQGQFHGAARHFRGSGVGGAFVEGHDDVGAQRPLYCHGFLGSQEHPAPVHRGAEFHPGFPDFAQRPQAEHLKPAGIREDGTGPAHEAVQAAMGADDIGARPQHQVKGIAEDDVGAGVPQLGGADALDGAIGAHRHERRGFHLATGEGEATAPGAAILIHELELHVNQSRKP